MIKYYYSKENCIKILKINFFKENACVKVFFSFDEAIQRIYVTSKNFYVVWMKTIKEMSCPLKSKNILRFDARYHVLIIKDYNTFTHT